MTDGAYSAAACGLDNDLSWKIFLDRYTIKDLSRAFVPGDLAIVQTNDDPKWPKKEVARVIAVDGDELRLHLLTGEDAATEIVVPRLRCDRPAERTLAEVASRVGRAIAAVEPRDEARHASSFAEEIANLRLVPGGRVWAGAGSGVELTLFNCVAGETLIHTRRGLRRIDELSGPVEILTQGGVYRLAMFGSYGVQRLHRVTLDNGDAILATAGHEWLVSLPNGGLETVTTLELEGRCIPIQPPAKPAIDPRAAAHGLVFGGGAMGSGGKRSMIELFDHSRDLLPVVEPYARSVTARLRSLWVYGLPPEFKRLPAGDAGPAYWRGFIAGLLATDGSVDERGIVMLTQTRPDVMAAVRAHAPEAGFVCSVMREIRAASNFGANHAPCLGLGFYRPSVHADDLLLPQHRQRFEQHTPRTATACVVSVESTDRVEEVFCCNEPETHTMVVGQGYLTRQCYVTPNPRDSRQGIIDTLGQMVEIMARGGGVGINVSSLRPPRAPVKGVNGRSSGAVSWMDLYSRATGLVEQGGCFAPTVRIATDHGLIAAGELASRLERGERIQALTHEGPRTLTWAFRNGIKPLMRVTTKRGFQVDVTPDHRMAVLRVGGPETVPLRELEPGDEILVLLAGRHEGPQVALNRIESARSVMSATSRGTVRQPELLDPDLAYFLGCAFTHADMHSDALTLSTPDAHPAIRDRITSLARTLFGIEPSMEPGDGACANISIDSPVVVEWLLANGLLKPQAEAVRVPDAVFRSPASVQGAFVAGHFDAEGCDRPRRGGFGIGSVSLEMLRDLQSILASNGILGRIASTNRTARGGHTIHRLSVTGAEFQERFAAFAGMARRAVSASSRRNQGRGDAREAWHALGTPGSHDSGDRGGAWPRFSHRGLFRLRERVRTNGRTALADAVDRVIRYVPDEIESVDFVGVSEVVDFEVDDLHMLSGGGLYTSNSRRGALMLQLEIWHPDVWRFIDIKKHAGMVENANISLRISDAFMRAVQEDGSWDLVFPDTEDPDYDSLWQGDLDAWKRAGKRVTVFESVPARKLWRAITDSAWQCAEPGVVFSERHENDSNSWYFNPLICTNPCVTGDTLAFTASGIRRVDELWASQEPVSVLADGRSHADRFVPATAAFRTGFKPVVRLRTSEGYEVRATPDHRVYCETRGWVAISELRPGDPVRIANRGGGFGTGGTREEGRVLGWLVGGGRMTRQRAVLRFDGAERQALAAAFATAVNRVIRPGRSRDYGPVGLVEVQGRDAVMIASARLKEFAIARGAGLAPRRVPAVVWSGCRDVQRGFLEALFEARGRVLSHSATRPGIRLYAASRPLLVEVQRLLLNFGLFSRISRTSSRRPAGGMARRRAADRGFQLVLAGRSVERFGEAVGFLGEAKRQDLKEFTASFSRGAYRERFTARVASVEEDGAEWVYDLTVPATQAFVANGLVVHNCAEQPLPAWGVCTLGHVNLARMVDGSGTDVDWARLSRTIRTGVRFLDDVVDATPYFFAENEDNQRGTRHGERRVGLGTLGLAELLIRLGHRYGALESEAFLDRLFAFIRDEAYRASVELAREKGAFPAFDAEKYLQSGFCRRLPEDIREAIRRDGIRNVTLLTQAPTGTTGTMVNTSTGIEPFFSFKFFRQSRLGFDEQWVPLAEDWLKAHPGDDLPNWFVSAMQLTPEDHIAVQAIVQRYTDSSISKTANAPHEYTRDQTARLYELAYDKGCKGVTIYRDGSRYEQVLHDASTAEAGGAQDGDGSAQEGAPGIGDALAAGNGDGAGHDERASVAVQAASSVGVQGRHAPPARPRPDIVRGRTVRMQAPEGSVFVTLNEHPDGTPFEIFVQAGKAGSDLAASTEAVARLVSLALRSGIAVTAIIDQLSGIGGRSSVGYGPKRVRSVADAIAMAMRQVWLHEAMPDGPAPVAAAADTAALTPAPLASPVLSAAAGASGANGVAKRRGDLCPACGEYALVYQEGCVTCAGCGHSEC